MFDRTLYLKAAEKMRHNAGQWAAYESARHCVLLAGPGSGKTKTLTVKLARMLAEDVQEPRGIACITYNNECARELEQRLEALGVDINERVFVGTVHSFSLTQIILPYAKTAKMGLPDDFRVANQEEQQDALQRAYGRANAGGIDRFRMEKYRRSILNRNSAEWNDTNPACARLVMAYEEELRAQGLIDFDDMPLLSLRALIDHKWLREAIRAKYPILVVDEYQDLGRALHRIVMGLCFSSGIRLFAVGDIDQSIYGFTGAMPEVLKKLSEREDVDTIKLRLNYRCGSSIVNASKFVLGEERDYESPEGAIAGAIYFHPQTGGYDNQVKYLFDRVIPEILSRTPGLTLGDIAILYSAARVGDTIANAAKEHGIGIIRTDGNAIYPRSSRLIRWLEQCAVWCCNGWKNANPRFSKIVSEGERIFTEALISEKDKMNFQKTLLSFLWARRNKDQNLHSWLVEFQNQFLKEYIDLSRIMSDERVNLNNFIIKTSTKGECKDMTLAVFCGHGSEHDRINLSTLHSSKGREFRVVILFGIDSGSIPRNNANEKEQKESRRLFYVGFTRAKDELHIAYSERNPSPFVLELINRLNTESNIP